MFNTAWYLYLNSESISIYWKILNRHCVTAGLHSKTETISAAWRLYFNEETDFLNYHVLNATNGEGDGTQLQYSCLENPMDGGAW